MNRPTIFLLVAITVLLSGVASRRSFENSGPIANAPVVIPIPVAAHPPSELRRKPAAASKQIANGETPDDYVYARPAASAVARVPGTTNAKPVVSTSRTTTSAAASTHERAAADTAITGDDLTRTARRLELITSDETARAESYEKLAAIRLQQGDFYQAYEMFASALRKGGQASFVVLHDHTRGNFDSGPNDTCEGALSILPDKLMFDGADGHSFAVAWTELLEAGSNRFVGSRIGGFHVKVGANKKSRNFNLAPRSRDKREANIILDLLIDNAERQSRESSDHR